MLVLLVAIAVFGPFFAPHGPTAFVGAARTPDRGNALFGTDHIGQDVWSRFLWGGARCSRGRAATPSDWSSAA